MDIHIGLDWLSKIINKKLAINVNTTIIYTLLHYARDKFETSYTLHLQQW